MAQRCSSVHSAHRFTRSASKIKTISNRRFRLANSRTKSCCWGRTQATCHLAAVEKSKPWSTTTKMAARFAQEPQWLHTFVRHAITCAYARLVRSGTRSRKVTGSSNAQSKRVLYSIASSWNALCTRNRLVYSAIPMGKLAVKIAPRQQILTLHRCVSTQIIRSSV